VGWQACTLKREDSDWCILYGCDQYLYPKPGTEDQGFGLFGRLGFSDVTVNPVSQVTAGTGKRRGASGVRAGFSQSFPSAAA
jgi:hypothetical protein